MEAVLDGRRGSMSSRPVTLYMVYRSCPIILYGRIEMAMCLMMILLLLRKVELGSQNHVLLPIILNHSRLIVVHKETAIRICIKIVNGVIVKDLMLPHTILVRLLLQRLIFSRSILIITFFILLHPLLTFLMFSQLYIIPPMIENTSERWYWSYK